MSPTLALWMAVAARQAFGSDHLYQCPCNPSDTRQLWDFTDREESSGPHIQFESQDMQGGCIDSFNCNYLDKPLLWYPCENPGGTFYKNQIWKQEGNELRCSNIGEVQQCLDGGQKQVGTSNEVRLEDCNGNDMQQWYLNKAGTKKGLVQLAKNSAVCLARCDQYQSCNQCCLAGCGDDYPVGPPVTPGGDGLSDYFPIFGFLFLLLCTLGTIGYIVIGILVNIKMRHKEMGKEAIPNVEFWLMFPVFVKDGAVFLFREIKRFCGWVHEKIQERRGR